MSREYFLSLTVAGGTGWSRWDDSDLDSWARRNKDLPVRILVGEFDEEGLKEARRVADHLGPKGVDIELKILESMLAGEMLEEIEENAGL